MQKKDFPRVSLSFFAPALKILIIGLKLLYNAIIKEKAHPESPKTQGRGRTDRRHGKERQRMDCIIKQVGGHVEVYSSTGAFLLSADNTREAMEELAG